MANEGRVPSVISSPDMVRAAVASQGGDGTMEPGGLTFGRLVDGGRAGKLLAMYRKVSGGAGTTYNLAHDLGVVPAWCILLGCDNPGTATILVANWLEWDKWTASEVRMRVAVSLGTQNGTAMWFLIGGER